MEKNAAKLKSSQAPQFVVLTHEFFPFRGGVATYCAEIAAAGIENECTVEVWTTGTRSTAPSTIPVMRISAGSRLHPFHLVAFAWGILKHRSTLVNRVVVLASVGAQMAWMFANRLHRIPVKSLITLFHGSEIVKYQRRSWWRSAVADLIRGSGSVVCVSQAVETLFRTSPWGSLTSSVVVAPGAPSSVLRSLVNSVTPTGSAEGQVIILTLARIHPRKGQLETATALGRLPKQARGRVEYWIAGKGDNQYLQHVEACLLAAGVRWRYFGEVSDQQAAELYAGCDFFVMSSLSRPDSIEGLGLSYLEAGMFGKPSVAFDSGGVREAVVHLETGLVAPEGNIDTLAECLLQLIEEPELRTKLGNNARQHSAQFVWRETAAKVFGR